jgi:hypothetical protein
LEKGITLALFVILAYGKREHLSDRRGYSMNVAHLLSLSVLFITCDIGSHGESNLESVVGEELPEYSER